MLKELLILEQSNKISKSTLGDLTIWCYKQNVAYERSWTPLILQCRGLITDSLGNIIARPFEKFFNVEEPLPLGITIPKATPEVIEKMDGSLGILFWYNGIWQIATKGSFASTQAIWANEFLNAEYSHLLKDLDNNFTYLLEIIWLENTIVLSYKSEGLYLIGKINTQTGEEEWPPINPGFPEPQKWNLGYDELPLQNSYNREGFVLRYPNGVRQKYKFEEYIRLHRIITNCSSYDIWDALRKGSFDQILDNVPDEFYTWVKGVENQILSDFQKRYDDIEKEWQKISLLNLSIRKDFAKEILKSPFRKELFLKLDNVSYDALIWEKIKPPFSKAKYI